MKEERLWVPISVMGWFGRLKRWFGFGEQTRREAEVPESVPAPMIYREGEEYSQSVAINEFGESFIGVVEIGPLGPRVTAGTYAKNVNHLTLSKQNLGPLQTGQRRFGFARHRGGITIGPSSTGAIPTVTEIPDIRTALRQRGYLIADGVYLIVAEDGDGELHVYNLLTGDRIQ